MLDAASLPTMSVSLPSEAAADRSKISQSWYARDDKPSIRLQVMRTALGAGVEHSSCLQMDRAQIYLTYGILSEALVREDEGNTLGPAIDDGWPAGALEGFGICVKRWSFKPDLVVV